MTYQRTNCIRWINERWLLNRIEREKKTHTTIRFIVKTHLAFIYAFFRLHVKSCLWIVSVGKTCNFLRFVIIFGSCCFLCVCVAFAVIVVVVHVERVAKWTTENNMFSIVNLLLTNLYAANFNIYKWTKNQMHIPVKLNLSLFRQLFQMHRFQFQLFGEAL